MHKLYQTDLRMKKVQQLNYKVFSILTILKILTNVEYDEIK